MPLELQLHKCHWAQLWQLRKETQDSLSTVEVKVRFFSLHLRLFMICRMYLKVWVVDKMEKWSSHLPGQFNQLSHVDTWKIQVVPTGFCDAGTMNYEVTQLGTGQFVGLLCFSEGLNEWKKCTLQSVICRQKLLFFLPVPFLLSFQSFLPRLVMHSFFFIR